MTAMKISVLTRVDEVRPLREAWAALDEACRTHPFSGPHPFFLWWDHFGSKEGYEPRIVVAWEGERLVGVLPLVLSRAQGPRVLSLMGKVFFDYGGALAQDEFVGQALWKAAQETAFDVLLLQDVSLTSIEGKIWEPKARRITRNGAPRLEISWPSVEAWQKTFSSDRRRKMRIRRRKLEEIGSLKFETHFDAIDCSVVETMLRQKRETAAGLDTGSIIHKEGIEDFFFDLFNQALAQGRGFWCVLKCGDKALAYLFHFYDCQMHFGYMISFDRDYASMSPGFVMLEEVIGWMINRGDKGYDFMRGSEDYKSRYTTTYEDLPTFVLGKTFVGKVYAWFYQQTYLYGKPLKYKWLAARNKKVFGKKR